MQQFAVARLYWYACGQKLQDQVGAAVQVYMITYHESVEVARFQMASSREKKAFMNLIRKKAHMVLPVDEVPPCLLLFVCDHL